MAAALDASPAAGEFFDSLARFYRNAWLRWVDATKRQPELRAPRIPNVVELLVAGTKERPREPKTVTCYVLVHGAGSSGSYWHLVEPLLRAAGHDVVAPDLPCDDPACGLAEYADTIVATVRGRRDLVVVAQSLAGFSAPLVCDRVDVAHLVLVAAMIPWPGESPGEWFANTGWEQARNDHAEATGQPVVSLDDPVNLFLHDVPANAAAGARVGEQADTPFGQPWPLQRWPDVATTVIIARNDRMFPAPFQRWLANERLGLEPIEIDSGHLPALAQPSKLARLLLS